MGEVKTADGIVRGAYKYVDTDGILQTVEYIADGGGFRVAATNLPTAQAAPVGDTPEVAAAKAAHYAALEESERNAQGVLVAAPVVQAAAPVSQAASYVPATYATNYAYQTPVAPVVATADAANTQYHAQDDFGQFNYGYSNPLSTKQELKTADGVTRGSYSYVDANGIIQTVNYLSDALGFRVAATNLPVHHVDAAPAAAAAAAPVAVAEEAPAVVDAYTPVAEEKVMTPSVQYAYLPYAQNYEYYGAATPVVQAAAPVVQAYAQPTPVVQAAAPVVQAAAPVVQAAAPVVPVAVASPEPSQYHAQDDFGQLL